MGATYAPSKASKCLGSVPVRNKIADLLIRLATKIRQKPSLYTLYFGGEK